MSGLGLKVESARALIGVIATQYKAPVVACSFGKDSMVLLHIVIESGLKEWPVVFFREPFFFPGKYAFANRVMNDWGIPVVYDFPPNSTSVFTRNGHTEIVSHYRLSPGNDLLLPTGCYEPTDFSGRWLCGLKDLLMKPLGGMACRWDVMLAGHKSSDHDPLRGKLTLDVGVKINPGSVDVAYPIHDWEDADVWEYTERFGLPVHAERYEKVGGTWRERDDRTHNPDWFPTCTRCLDKTQPKTVYCPMKGVMVNNISGSVPRSDQQIDDFDEAVKK